MVSFRWMVLLLCCARTTLVYSQDTDRHIGQERLYFGVAYYPEAWEMETVDEDIVWMKKANINVVRMSEFAWSLMEPEEGQYDFGWLHEVIEQLHASDIDVILGTPTATPPIWMAEKYPEMFIVDEHGHARGHGSRRNTNYVNADYVRLSKKICREMAKAFGNKPGVIAWQIDNEFHLSSDFSEDTERCWHQWLENRYGTIGELNRTWATNLWSQRYQAFEQVPMAGRDLWHHSSLRYNWKQFISDLVVDFQKVQVEAIREYSDLPITHDGMPGQQINYPDLFENLDFVSTNFYHNYSAYGRVQTNFDRLRGYQKEKMHWVFETAPNHSGGGKKGQTWFIHQPPGSLRAILWSHLALGGQGLVFWLWRQHPAGQEMPHGAFLSAWGKPFANFEQLSALGGELADYGSQLLNSEVTPAELAILYSHEATMGLTIEEISNGVRYYNSWTEHFYRPLSDAFLHRDVIHQDVSLDRYKVLFVPLAPSLDAGFVERMKTWVEGGGTLILGPMSGYRSENWTAFRNHALGDFGRWTGIEVEHRLPIDSYNVKDLGPAQISFNEGMIDGEVEAQLWTEALSAGDGKVIAQYTNGWQKGMPAIMERPIGEGKVVYLGTAPSNQAMQSILVRYAEAAGIAPLASGDKDVLVVPRQKDGESYQFVINLANDQRSVILNQPIRRDILSGKVVERRSLEPQPFEVLYGKTSLSPPTGSSR
ncbi:MAG: beta-galactosidase [Bacteroidota bacterium]